VEGHKSHGLRMALPLLIQYESMCVSVSLDIVQPAKSDCFEGFEEGHVEEVLESHKRVPSNKNHIELEEQ
jgi:hypothetical protein